MTDKFVYSTFPSFKEDLSPESKMNKNTIGNDKIQIFGIKAENSQWKVLKGIIVHKE